MHSPLTTRRLIYDWAEREDVPRRRFAIVLGCGVRDGQPCLVLADRLRAGLALYRADRVERVVASGNEEQVPVMTRWLAVRGVREADIVADPRGVRTLATMRRAATRFGVSDAVICTNRFHVHRSVFLARAQGIDAVGLACDHNVYAKRRVHEARELVAWGRALYDVYLGGLRPRRGSRTQATDR